MDGLKAYSNGMEYKPKTNINQIDDGCWSLEKNKSQIEDSNFFFVIHPSIHLCQYWTYHASDTGLAQRIKT